MSLGNVMIETHAAYSFNVVPPARYVPSLAEDALQGLFDEPRFLSPKYFYDERGSQLFDQICDTAEYYPTRVEAALLDRHAGSIIEQVRPRHILEFGSGTSRKTRYLLDACREVGNPVCYWPFDICDALLHDVSRALLDVYPELGIRAQCGDFTAGIQHLPRPPEGEPCLYLFLGGTIGNFDQQLTRLFLDEVAEHMRPGDALLMGADRVKDRKVLHEAYNDSRGLTAAFNLNLLKVLNDKLGADFDPGLFQHHAAYNERYQQIEMHLIASREQSVSFAQLDCELEMQKDEAILTEISRKFRPEELQFLIEEAGLDQQAHLEPENGWFSLVLARK